MPVDEMRHERRAEDLVGSVIADRYQIRSVIGTGAMSTVFVAWHLRLHCQVAVKVLHPTLASHDDHVEGFEREARSLARLDHPNCLRVLDYGVTDDDLHFLVTELVRGVELRELMTGPCEPWLAARRIRQILAGLGHAHACGVIHRDLKPENILVTRGTDGDEQIKLVDFGIAKIVGSMPGSGLAMIVGTPQYMSPEQAAGRAVDYRSDLYSAGVLLYTMLSGRRPFHDEDPAVVVQQQIHDPPPPLPDTVPRRLAQITMQLLHKDSAQRFESAADAIAALEAAWYESVQVGATHRRRRWRAIASLAVACVGVLAITLVDPLPAPDPSETLGPLTLADADRLLANGEPARAHAILSALLDREPHDAELLWRDGQALAATGERARALGRFADALEQDDDLIDDPHFVVGLDDLLRRPELEVNAIDLALQRLDGAGDEFLLDAVNRREHPLDYVTRHRMLTHLRRSAHIDTRWNARLDVEQAASAPDACLAYLHALQELAPEDLALVRDVAVPQPEVPTPQCEEAQARRDALLADLGDARIRG